MTPEEIARWEALLVGRLCRAVKEGVSPCPAIIVTKVERYTGLGQGAMYLHSRLGREQYFNANGWEVEVFGEGVVHA